MTPEPRPTPQRIEALDAEFSRAAVAAHRALYPAGGAEVLEVGGGAALYFGGLPLTRVLALGMSDPVGDEAFERLEAFYREREATVAIDLCPYADSSVLERLGRRGYRIASFKQLLIRPLGLEDRTPPEPKPGFAVVRAAAGDEETWTRVVAQGFLEREEVDERSHELYRTLFHSPTNTSWIATVDGEPAGGACLSMRDGFASLASACVRPEFRRRGVQAALIRARLAYAARSGCAWTRVCAYPGSASQRNLERHGFQVAYTRAKFTLGNPAPEA